MMTHRNNIENITYDTLAGRIMKLDLESGKILGRDGIARAPVHGRQERRDLRRQPDGQRVSLVSGVADAGGGRGGGGAEVGRVALLRGRANRNSQLPQILLGYGRRARRTSDRSPWRSWGTESRRE